jgi:hypothetical protein
VPEKTPGGPTQAPPQPAAKPHFKEGEKLTLDFIHMVSLEEGWALQGPYVLVTQDGGVTWREVTPPELFPEGILAQAYASFADESTAWVVYGFDPLGSSDPAYAFFQIAPEASVWVTYNAGRTWIPSPPLRHEVYGDTTWAEFAVVDDITVWMMVRGMYVGAGTHYTAELFRSVDGVNWQPIPDSDVGVDYTGMVFADRDNGWLTWQTIGAYAAAPPEYAVTSDSGFNWEVRELPAPDDSPDLFEKYEYCEPYQPNLLSASEVKLLVACFDYYDPPRDFISYLYSSDDGGDHWQMFALPKKVNGAKTSLIFFDNRIGLLLGRNMFETKDGGETWDFIKTVNWDGQFSFVDELNGWAIARNEGEIALVHTEDGGRTWSQLEPAAGR